SIDVTAKSFKAIARNRANATLADIVSRSQLEFSGNLTPVNNNLSLGWADPLNVTGYNGNYELAGYFNGSVNVTGVTGNVEVIGIYAQNDITLGGGKITASGPLSAGGNIAITATGSGGIDIAPDSELIARGNGSIALTTTASGADMVMEDGTILDSNGAITLTTTGSGADLTMGRITGGAGAVTINAGGRLLDGDGAISNGFELANITASGTINVTATGGIGSADDRFVISASTVNHLNSGANGLFAELQGAVTVTNLDAGRADLWASSGGLVVGSGDWIVGGDLMVTSVGNFTDTGKLTVAGAATLNGGGSDIILDSAANDFNSVTLTAGNVTLRDADGLAVGGILTGNLNVTATTVDLTGGTIGGGLTITGSGAITDSGAMVVTGSASLTAGSGNDIILDAASDFVAGVTVVSGRNVSLTDVNGLSLAGTISGTLAANAAGTLTLGATSVTGAASLTAGNDITDSAALTFGSTLTLTTALNRNIVLDTAGNDFNSVVIAGAQDVTLKDQNALTLSGSVGGNLQLTGGALTMGVTTVGGQLTATAVGASFGDVTIGGNLNLTTTGAVSDTGVLTVKGTTTLSAAGQTVTLDSADNDFVAAVNVSGAGTLSLADRNDLALSGAVSGTLTLVSGGGSLLGIAGSGSTFGALAVTAGDGITDGGALTIGGTTWLTAGGGDIALDAANNFVGAVSIVGARDVTLNDINALDLGAGSMTGNLLVTAAGNLTDSGALLIGGTASLDVGTGNNVVLDGAGNDFGGAVTIVHAKDVTLRDANALSLANAVIAGNLNLHATGTLSNASAATAWTVTGTTTLDADGGDVLLASANNDFSGAIGIVDGRNVTLVDVNSALLGNVTLSGDLTMTTGGLLNATGVVVVPGAVVLDAGANDIVFGNADNDFGSLRLVQVGSATITDKNALRLDEVNATGLTLTVGGPLTSAGPMVVSGATGITASGQDVTLTDSGNDFGGSVAISARNVALSDVNGLDFAASTLTGTLVVNAGGAITDSGKVAVTGTALLDAGGHAITLDTASNDFGALVTVLGATSITLKDANALAFTGSAESGALQLTSSGAMTLGAVASSGNMTLGSGALSFDKTTVGGSLNVTASGAITQSAESALRVSGTTSLSGASLLLDNANNTFTGAVGLTTSAGAANLRVTGPLAFSSATITGNLTLNANGDLTDGGTVRVTGATNLNVGTGNDIVLDSAGNDFGGMVTLTVARDVTLNDSNALAVAGTTERDLNVTAGGVLDMSTLLVGHDLLTDTAGLTQTGRVEILGTTTLEADNDIQLNTQANLFHGAVTVTLARDANLKTTGMLDFSGTMSGDLTLDAAGITDAGRIQVSGATSLTAGSGNDIVLDTANNDFGGMLTVNSARDVTLRDANALSIQGQSRHGDVLADGQVTVGNLNMSGNLKIDAQSGSIQQAVGTNLSLAGGLTLAGNSATVRSTNALSLAGATLAGHFDITASAGLTQSGKIAVTGTTTLNTGNLDLILGDATNDFDGAVHVTSSRDILLRDANRLTFSGSASGNADILAATQIYLGATNVAGTLDARGNFTMTADITGKEINLNSSNFLDMAGFTATATDGGHIFINAQDYIKLGRLVTDTGHVTVRSVHGSIEDGYLGSGADIVTSGEVSLVADTGMLKVKLWGASDAVTDDTAFIDVVAGQLGDVKAHDGVTITRAGGSKKFVGSLVSDGDLTLDFGAEGIDMDASASLVAANNLTVTATGNLALARLSAGNIATISGAVITSADGYTNGANIQAETINLTATTIDALRLDATTIDTLQAGNASLTLLSTQDVTLGANSNWTIGGNLTLAAATANLTLAKNITASTLDLDAQAGRFDMGTGTIVNATGTLRLAGQAGLGVTNIVGATGTITLASAMGNISDLTSDELANITSQGNLVLAARSIGAGGVADIDVDVARIHSVTTTGGGAWLESLKATGVVLGNASVSNALNLVTGQGNLLLDGNQQAGLLVLDAQAGNLVQNDGFVLGIQGAATLNAGGDIRLARLEGGSGAVALTAGGDLIDNSLAETANLTLATGALTIEASHVGSVSEDFDLAVASIASFSAQDAHIESQRSVRVETWDTASGTTFRQTTGDLNLAGPVRVNTLTMNVTAGSLLQADGATLTVTGDLGLQASGDIALSSMTSLAGSVTLTAGGTLLDATETERALITTGAAHTVTLTAASIGADGDNKDIEIDTGRLAAATAASGGAWLSFAKGVEVGNLATVSVASLGVDAGNLLLSGSVQGARVEVDVANGSLTMGNAATITATNRAELTTSGDMTLRSLITTDAQLTAGGVLLDNGTGVTATGQVEIRAGSIGASVNAFDLYAANLNRLTVGGDAYLVVDSASGLTLGVLDAGTHALDLTLQRGDLTLEESLKAGSAALHVQQGRFVMNESTFVKTIGDLEVETSGDVLLARLTTESGLLSIQAGGAIQDHSALEIPNIEATGTGSRVVLSGTAIGTSAVDGDIDLNVARIDALTATTGGVYLQSTRDLTLGPASIAQDLQLEVSAGSLTLFGQQSADHVTIAVPLGAITMQDGGGMTGRLGVDLHASRDISLSSVVVQTGNLSMLSDLGGLIDGSSLETPNLRVDAGSISLLKGQFVGNRYDGGGIDVAAMDLQQVSALSGGVFLDLVGTAGQSVAVCSLTANGAGADVALTTKQGGMAIDSLTANDDLSIRVASSLLLDQVQAGGNVIMSGSGILDQTTSGRLAIDGIGKSAVLAFGGAVLLDNAQNDFNRLNVNAASASLVDQDGLTLFGASTLTTNLDLTANGGVTLEDKTLVKATSGMLNLTVNAGDLLLAGEGTLQSGAAMDVRVGGSMTSVKAATITAGDSLTIATGGAMRFAGNSRLSAATSMNVTVAEGGLTASGTTAMTTRTGAITLNVTDGGVVLAGTSTVQAGTGLTITQGSGGFDARGKTTLLAKAGDLSLGIGAGTIQLRDTTDMRGNHVTLSVSGAGDLDARGSTTMIARSGNLTVNLGDGALAMQGTNTLTGAANLSVATGGSQSYSGASTMTANAGALDLLLGNGKLSFAGASTLAATTDVGMRITRGNLATSGATTLNAGRDAILTMGQGNATLTNRTLFEATRDFVIAIGGNLDASGLTTLQAGHDLSLSLTGGTATTANTTLVKAANLLNLSFVNGGLTTHDATTLTAGLDLAMDLVNGKVELNDTTTLYGGRHARFQMNGVDFAASGTTTITAASGNLTMGVNGSQSFEDTSTLTARNGLIDWRLSNGTLDFAGTSTLTAAKDIGVAITNGALATSGTTRVTAGGNITMATSGGSQTFTGDSSLITDTGRIDWRLTNANLLFDGVSTLATAMEIGVRVDSGNFDSKGNTTLRATRNIAVTGSQGNHYYGDNTTLTALTGGITMDLTEIQLRFAQAATLTAANDIGIALELGNLMTSGTPTLNAGRHLTLHSRGAQIFGGVSTLMAGQNLTIDILDSKLITNDATSFTAGQDILVSLDPSFASLNGRTRFDAQRDLAISIDGNLDTSGATTLQAGRDLSIDLFQGSAVLTGTTRAMAGGALTLDVDTGNLHTLDATTLAAGQDLLVNVNAGNLRLAGTTNLSGAWNQTLAITGKGDFSTNGTTTLTAGSGDLSVSVADGALSMQGNSTLRAPRSLALQSSGSQYLAGSGLLTATDIAMRGSQGIEVDGPIAILSGLDTLLTFVQGNAILKGGNLFDAGRDLNLVLGPALEVSGSSALRAGHDISVSSGSGVFSNGALARGGNRTAMTLTGGLSMQDIALLDAGVELAVNVGAGNVRLAGAARFHSDRDVKLNIGSGELILNADGAMRAENDLIIDIRDQGGLTMADANTLLEAGNQAQVRVANDALLKLIRARSSVILTSTRGGIFDNTVSENALIVTDTLTLNAVRGVGTVWIRDIDTDVRTLNILNTASGGINLFNQSAFRVGEYGVTNSGAADIVLRSGGIISYAGIRYQTGVQPWFISSSAGQNVSLLNNFEAESDTNIWRNPLSVANIVTSATTAIVPQIQLQTLSMFDAMERQLKAAHETELDYARTQPIRPAQMLGNQRMILQELGLAQVASVTNETYAQNLLEEIKSMQRMPVTRESGLMQTLAWNVASASGEQARPQGLLNDILSLSHEIEHVMADGYSSLGPATISPSYAIDGGMTPGGEVRSSLQRVMQLADDTLDAPMLPLPPQTPEPPAAAVE
ncbi:MAG: hypothetical protein HQM03_14570, partial [Magnetococcales bacterium]|nr:hypothetical protein [Magnetococcales bacterium]